MHHALLRDIRGAHPMDVVPSVERLRAHLSARRAAVGDTAFAEFAYLQKVAAETWGAGRTAHFARVLRDARVAPKLRRGCRWTAAEAQVASLPADWQQPLRDQIAISRSRRTILGRTPWSVDYTQSVLSALRRWVAYCRVRGLPLNPTATTLHGYAVHLVEPGSDATPRTAGTAANYSQRIMAGLSVATGGQFRSEACAFVVADWRERSRTEGAITKTGSQLVGASALYALGFRMIGAAQAQPMRGVGAATTFRNGLILAVGAALPERARALSWLEFDRTLVLLDDTHIHVTLPGQALKGPEARKARAGYDVVFQNPRLAMALHAYRAEYRPLFDDGLHLFPSVHGKPGGISSGQLGKLTGDLTEKEFGVRIPIHRVRDNVATEAAENLIGGAFAAKTLLRHVDEGVTRRHYDHSEGLKAAGAFEDFVESRRKVTADLLL